MAPLASSASAPDIGSRGSSQAGRQVKDRARLQNLLTKATSGGSKRAPLGKRLAPLRPLGGAPRALAPASSSLPGFAGSPGAGGDEVSRSPATRSASVGNSRQRGGASPEQKERATDYIRNLTDHPTHGALDWRLVTELDTVDNALQEEQARRQMHAHKQALRTELLSQHEDACKRHVDNRADQRRWQDKLQSDANAFYQEQSEKRDVTRQAAHILDSERARLLEMTNQRKQAEKDHDLWCDRDMAERNVAARRVEVAKAEEKKRRDQENTLALAKERAKATEAKREKKRMEANEEKEAVRMQIEAAEKAERARTEKFEIARDAQAKRMAKSEANFGNAEKYLAVAEEASMKKGQEHGEKRDKQIDEAKKQVVRKIAQECQASVRTEVEKKKAKWAKEREEELRLARELRRDADASMDEEKLKVENRRLKAKEHSNFLLSQMASKGCEIPGRYGFEQMNGVEKSMNRDRLDRAKSSESLQLLHRNKQLQFQLAGK